MSLKTPEKISLSATEQHPAEQVHVPTFTGATPEQQQWFLNLVNTVGMPLDYVYEVEFSTEAKVRFSGGSFHFRIGQYSQGKLTLFPKSIDWALRAGGNPLRNKKRSFNSMLAEKVIHELAHAQSATIMVQKNTPSQTELENDLSEEVPQGYGESIFTKNEAVAFSALIKQVLDQLLKTKKFFSPYDKYLVENMYNNGHLRRKLSDEYGGDPERFLFFKLIGELEAILVEMYIANPKKLLQVEQAQRKKLSGADLENYISPTELVEKLLMHTTKRTLTRVRESHENYKDLMKQAPF